VHPQLPALAAENPGAFPPLGALLDFLAVLARDKRIQGIGETGFDLYSDGFRETLAVQEKLFNAHLELALAYDLPLVFHVRKAMHKVFAYKQALKRLPAVLFHAYPGTLGEGRSLLRQGINGYFSFGASLLWGRKESLHSCAGLPLDRLLLETDAPYQPLPGAAFSTWQDLPVIRSALVRLRPDYASSSPSVLEFFR
jgi:TatD DNase family protein